MIIAIDGPSASGKSTVARKIAKNLGFLHVNSGALFRAVAYKAEREGVSLDNEDELARIASETEFTFVQLPPREGKREKNGGTNLLVDGEDITSQLISSAAGENASRVAVYPKLRDVLLQVQRNAAKRNSVVVEGRDASTVVFPDADLKIYLDGSIKVRAMRRFNQLSELGTSDGGLNGATLEEIQADMEKRDHRDSTREIAPQKQADDAIIIDTTTQDADKVVDEIAEVARKML